MHTKHAPLPPDHCCTPRQHTGPNWRSIASLAHSLRCALRRAEVSHYDGPFTIGPPPAGESRTVLDDNGDHYTAYANGSLVIHDRATLRRLHDRYNAPPASVPLATPAAR